MSADMTVNTEISQYYYNHSYCKDTAEEDIKDSQKAFIVRRYSAVQNARSPFVYKRRYMKTYSDNKG